jgi:8-oxo-dGTP pyrophosphatase MutT (NUDIX family)
VDALRATLTGYAPVDAVEATDVARAVALLDTGDPWSREHPLHVTASALVVHPPTRRVLLRWHARMAGWLQVGGHGDPGESDPWAVALREAAEETGLPDLAAVTTALERTPVQVVVVSVPPGKGEPAHEHVDVRYVLATATPDAVRAETSDAPVRWFTVEEARALVAEPNLRTFLGRVEEILDRLDPSPHHHHTRGAPR